MTKSLLCSVLVLAGASMVSAAEMDFWNQLTAQERAAAGLETLSPAQQQALNTLAARFAKEGARQAVEVAKVEAKAEAKAEAEKSQKAKEAAQIGFNKTADEAETITSKIEGTFQGWSGQTLFRLANGQTWVQADQSDVNWLPKQEGPEVQITKSGAGGWKLQILPNGRWVRVKRVK